MNVDIRMLFEPSHHALCLVKRILKRERICPGEVCLVRIGIEVFKGMSKSDCQSTLFLSPEKRSGAAFPSSLARTDPKDWSQSHLVKFCLLGHSFDCKSKCLTTENAFHTEIKPRAEVANVGVGQAVSIHVASKVIGISL